ncbi:MAG: amino acid ABC transporter substrate-binding protein [Motiliproteus sp.]
MMLRKIGALTLGLAATCMALEISATEYYGTLKKIYDSGTIVVGHRESSVPFSYLNKAQEPVGYSIDLCKEIVDEVSMELGKAINVEYVPINSKTRIPLLENGSIDIECGSTTNNLTRQKQINFTHVTYITGTKLLVKKDSGIKEVEDLAGKKIALAQGTTNERIIKKVAKEKGIDIKVLPVKDHSQGFSALKTGQVDAYSSDDILLYGLITKANKLADYKVTGRFLSYDPYALMVRKDDSAFQLVANRRLSELFRNGKIDRIYNKWFMDLGVGMSKMLQFAIQIQTLPQ